MKVFVTGGTGFTIRRQVNWTTTLRWAWRKTRMGDQRWNVRGSHEAMVYATNWVQLENKETEKDLKISFRPFEESLVETIGWLERENHINRVQAGLLSRHNLPG